MQIHGYSQLTLLDYPEFLACTIFCGRCNLRCPFCHNASLVLRPGDQPALSEDKILEHLKGRIGILEGVCITGGEPTLQPDLPQFIEKLKNLGFKVKLDTNGTNPELLENLFAAGLLDYVAMDIKSSPSGYATATGLSVVSMDKFFRSSELIIESGVNYEFRTTVVDELHSDADIVQIGRWLKGARAYYLQQYKDSGDLIAPEGLHAPTHERLTHLRELVLPYIPNTHIRTSTD